MEDQYKYLQTIIKKKYLFPPSSCSCGNNKFSLGKLNRKVNNKFCFICTRKNCKKVLLYLKLVFMINLNIFLLLIVMKYLNVF